MLPGCLLAAACVQGPEREPAGCCGAQGARPPGRVRNPPAICVAPFHTPTFVLCRALKPHCFLTRSTPCRHGWRAVAPVAPHCPRPGPRRECTTLLPPHQDSVCPTPGRAVLPACRPATPPIHFCPAYSAPYSGQSCLGMPVFTLPFFRSPKPLARAPQRGLAIPTPAGLLAPTAPC
jgi:hypothetical protein